jgi:hypothetical protein
MGCPRLKNRAKLLQSIVALSMLAAHVRDITNLPETDEQGETLLRQYFERLTVHISTSYQAVLHSATEIGNYIAGVKDVNERPNLINVMEGLVSLKSIISPKSEVEKGFLYT